MPKPFFVDLQPKPADFLGEAVQGLSSNPKTLPSKFFYNNHGMKLFHAICETPEYYVTRTERSLIDSCKSLIAQRVNSNAAVVEFGCGGPQKALQLLRALHKPHAFIGVDIAAKPLKYAVNQIQQQLPIPHVGAVCTDFTSQAKLPPIAQNALKRSDSVLGFFPGSTIGNFTPSEALSFLQNARHILGPKSSLLIGVDRDKDPKTLEAAYNDKQGLTAAFNKNVLSRLKNELNADVDVDAFSFRAVYNKPLKRVESYLTTNTNQNIRLNGHSFPLQAGDSIHTENSHKYGPGDFLKLAQQAQWNHHDAWHAPNDAFSVHLLSS